MKKSTWVLVHDGVNGPDVRIIVAKDFDPSSLCTENDIEALARLSGLKISVGLDTLQVFPFDGGKIPVITWNAIRRSSKKRKRAGGCASVTVD